MLFIFAKKMIKKYRQVLMYGVIGGSAALLDVVAFYVLYTHLNFDPTLATVVSVGMATIYSFILNAFHNFRVKDMLAARMGLFLGVSFLGLALSALIIHQLTSGHDMNGNIAKIISLPPIVLIQYLLNANITFKKFNKKKPSESAVPIKTAPPIDSFSDGLASGESAQKIAVVGAGFTGLVTAYQLAKKGYRVDIIERSSDVGGLVADFELEGVALEKAYHFIYKTDHHIIDLAKELGVADRLKFFQSSLSLYYDGVLYPFMTPMDLLRFKPLSLFDRIRAGVIALYLGKVKKWRGFAKISAYKWMMRWGGEKVTRVIWEPILKGKFFNYFDKIAMSYVWSRVHVRANSKDKGDVTEKLGYFLGGWHNFTDALADQCRAMGVQIRTEVTLEGIKEHNGKIYLQEVGSGESVYDACVATVPTHIFSKLLEGDSRISGLQKAKYNSIDYIGAVTMVFMTDRPLTKYYWHNINDINHPFLVLLSLSALIGPENLDGKHVYYIGAYVPHDHKYFSMTDEELTDLWVEGAQALFPDFTKNDITAQKIFRLRNAQHIVDVDYEKKIPPYRSVIPGVYLANFSQIFPDDRGTNYAVEEGKKMAALVDQDLKAKA